MDSKKKDNDLLIINIVWVLCLLLGIRFIYKYKLWKPKYYFILLVIFVTYIIVLYQIQIVWTCFPTTIETLENQNTTFQLYDRTRLIPQELLFSEGDVQTGYGNWDVQLKWPGPDKNGNPLTPNYYADDNNTDGKGSGNVCNRENILQLTELVSVSTQQLVDAELTYKSLQNIDDYMKQGKIIDLESIRKIVSEISDTNNIIKKQPPPSSTR
jgi:hypothetical protein